MDGSQKPVYLAGSLAIARVYEGIAYHTSMRFTVSSNPSTQTNIQQHQAISSARIIDCSYLRIEAPIYEINGAEILISNRTVTTNWILLINTLWFIFILRLHQELLSEQNIVELDSGGAPLTDSSDWVLKRR